MTDREMLEEIGYEFMRQIYWNYGEEAAIHNTLAIKLRKHLGIQEAFEQELNRESK